MSGAPKYFSKYIQISQITVGMSNRRIKMAKSCQIDEISPIFNRQYLAQFYRYLNKIETQLMIYLISLEWYNCFSYMNCIFSLVGSQIMSLFLRKTYFSSLGFSVYFLILKARRVVSNYNHRNSPILKIKRLHLLW